MLISPLVLTFFGLTPSYRNILFAQIHDLVFHGGGGFIHSEVYNMPIWLRKFHIQKINDFNKKQNEEIKNIEKGTNSNPNKITKPNINPSSTYNF
jgi:hypothetical protein